MTALPVTSTPRGGYDVDPPREGNVTDGSAAWLSSTPSASSLAAFRQAVDLALIAELRQRLRRGHRIREHDRQGRHTARVSATRHGRPAAPASRLQLRSCYIRSMTEIAARELRNHTAEVLRRVEAGEQVTITSRGRPVAELIGVRSVRRRPIARAELVRRLGAAQADPGLRSDLAVLAGETTDDLGPIR